MTTIKDRIREAIIEYREAPFEDTGYIRAIPDEDVLIEAIVAAINDEVQKLLGL